MTRDEDALIPHRSGKQETLLRHVTDYRRLQLLVLDVDGILTDGSITLTESGEEIKTFHVRDGSGIKYWMRLGKKVAIITGRGSPAVTRRAKELGIECVRLNCKQKLPAYEELCREMGVGDEQVVAMGDDLTDIPLLRRAAVGITVEQAPLEVKEVATFVTRTPGGKGCVREAIEMMLRNSGEWNRILERYSENPPKDAL